MLTLHYSYSYSTYYYYYYYILFFFVLFFYFILKGMLSMFSLAP